jgi:hypothetical protein
MKTSYLTIACLLIISGFVSCSNSDAEESTETATTILPQSPADTVKQAVKVNSASTSSALNPAHGQPGHRCDIAVGAPLNSVSSVPVATAPVQIQQPQSAPLMQVKSQPASAPLMQAKTQPAQSSAPVQTSPSNNIPKPVVASKANAAATGLNPAHGQPGHRCDIAVGAPLNSAPKPAQAAQPQTAPLQVVPNLSAKLNPAHGQPGHDCTIPVGQPLKNQ